MRFVIHVAVSSVRTGQHQQMLVLPRRATEP